MFTVCYIVYCCYCRQFKNASKIDHFWIAHDWLHSLGLAQYSAAFESQLVDARLLNVLGKKDLDKYLSVHRKFHQSSILYGVQLLRMIDFDRQVRCSATVWTGVTY